MVLTILIPVFNGARYLDSLLRLFADFALTGPGQDVGRMVEIIVVNNRSDDDTVQVAEQYAKRLSNFRVLNEEKHVPTAEENVFRAIPQCRGAYLWVLGVDDIPVFSRLPRVLDILTQGTYDFLIFNNPVFNEHGAITAASQFYLSKDCHEDEIVNFTERFGLWYTLAGMSGEILRLSCIKNFDFEGLLREVSAIYAHTVAYIECFAAKKLALVNLPLVLYRVAYRDTRHWSKAAKTLAVFDEHFWTVGLVGQLLRLEKRKLVDKGFIGRLLDRNEFEFFRPTTVLLDKIFAQLRVMSRSKEPRNQIKPQQFELLYEFLLEREPMTREALWALRSIFAALNQGRSIAEREWETADRLVATYRGNFLLCGLLQRTIQDYEIYRIANRWLAVHKAYRHVLVRRLMHIGEEELAPYVLAGAESAELENKVRQLIQCPPVEFADVAMRGTVMMPQNEVHDLLEARRLRDAILKSTSWRITAPLRSVVIAARRWTRFGRA